MITLLTVATGAAQTLALEGVSNARQLGGYVIGSHTVRHGALIRSANLHSATDADVAVLADTFRVAQIFDFRSTPEHDNAPDRDIPGATNYWLPCLDKAVKGIVSRSGTSSSATAPSPSSPQSGEPRGAGEGRGSGLEGLGESLLLYIERPELRQMAEGMYPMIVFDETVQGHYATFLRTLAELPEGHAALWHCTQGKDRAGWATALLLAALGADRDLIVEDFARSNDAYQPLVDALTAKGRAAGIADESLDIIPALIGVSVPNFIRTLDAITARYGSLDAYLTEAIHCDDDLRTRLRARFLE